MNAKGRCIMKNGKPATMTARLDRLEADVKEIKALLQAQQEPKQPWWEKIVGTHANDPIALEVDKEIADYREKERRKARRPRHRAKAKA
jgi:hypothetical protein